MKFLCFLVICFVHSIDSQRVNDEFQLPNTTKPTEYVVIITTNVPEEAPIFSGVVMITIQVLENTNEIFLHSRKQTIDDVVLYFSRSEMENVFLERENDEVIKITSEQELQAGSVYELQVGFQGDLLLSSDGFFRSSYVENVNGNDVYT